MSRTRFTTLSLRWIAFAAATLALASCATTPATSPASTAWAMGQEMTLEGAVIKVDTTPWTYDGNAIITVASDRGGTVQVQLPARWNLCKAQPLGDVQALKPGDRVRVAGTVSAIAELVVCAQPQHQLRKLE